MMSEEKKHVQLRPSGQTKYLMISGVLWGEL